MSEKLKFVTSHPDKAEQLSWHLDHPIEHQNLDIAEIQSLDIAEVATAKAEEAYRQLAQPVLVEDTSIRFEALGRLPGPLIKWFLEELGPDGLCKLLDGYDSRQAIVEAYFVYCDENGPRAFSAAVDVEVAKNPRGTNAFGTDSILIPQGYTETWGEMTKKEQSKTSVRRMALEKLRKYLSRDGP